MLLTSSLFRTQGFTWVELLVTMAILGVLVLVSAPGLQSLLSQRAVAVQATSLADALRLARSEAVKRHQKVTICHSLQPALPNPSCSRSSLDWASGWLIFVDLNGNKRLDAHETLLHVHEGLVPNGGMTVPTSKPAITFSPQGLAVANNASFQIRPLDAHAATHHHRCVRLAVSGRTRVQPGVC